MFENLSRDEIALAVGLIAFGGVLLTAVLNWLTISRSKYVETITAERIKWVGELRSDFNEFLSEVTELRKAHERKDPSSREISSRAYKRLVLIHLKLNPRSRLDREIMLLMSKAIREVSTGDPLKVQAANIELVTRVSDLLKDEWEAAKWESAGPIRRARIWWKRVGRWDEHRKRWKSQPQVMSADSNDVIPVSGADPTSVQPTEPNAGTTAKLSAAGPKNTAD